MPSSRDRPSRAVVEENLADIRAVRTGEVREGDVKELRVKIDVSYHLKLHALKLLRNKKMSEAVEEALDHYFEHVVNDVAIQSEELRTQF